MKSNYKDNDYVNDSITIAEKWAENMEERIDKGQTKMSAFAFDELKKSNPEEKIFDIELVTHFISTLWKYGDEFEKWAKNPIWEIKF